ncbi:hypothetical protein GCM10022377_19380 [Zhihengliuella alba]|uniref:Uncharacterized protein n=1 Tax=Zhihengliuella alba TaxID=547018 RepID=A0ABP7DKN4_9MICC
MHSYGVDPREGTAEIDVPDYRVDFISSEPSVHDERIVSGAPDVEAVLAWADAESSGRGYSIYSLCPVEDGYIMLHLLSRQERSETPEGA